MDIYLLSSGYVTDIDATIQRKIINTHSKDQF